MATVAPLILDDWIVFCEREQAETWPTEQGDGFEISIETIAVSNHLEELLPNYNFFWLFYIYIVFSMYLDVQYVQIHN